MNLAQGAALFIGMAIAVKRLETEALEKAAVMVEEEAKRVIGTYDYGWPSLATSTLKKKSDDTPLLETGALRDSISHKVHGRRAVIGTDDKAAGDFTNTRQ